MNVTKKLNAMGERKHLCWCRFPGCDWYSLSSSNIERKTHHCGEPVGTRWGQVEINFTPEQIPKADK